VAEEQFQLPEEVKITVLKAHSEETLTLLRNAGFEPDSTLQSDEATSFLFKTMTEDRMWKIISVVPPSYYAVRGIVGGQKWDGPDAQTH
jgi:hypothetical protein